MGDQDDFKAARQRRMFRAGVIYLAVAWLIYLVVAIVIDIWLLPAIVVQQVFLLLAFGLPVAVLLGWNLDISREEARFKRRTSLMEILRRGGWKARVSLTVAALVHVASIAYFWPNERLSPEASQLIMMNDRVQSGLRNINYGLYGVNAIDAQDMYALGRYRVETYKTTGELPPVSGDSWNFHFVNGIFCPLNTRGCIEQTARHPEAVEEFLEQEYEFLKRYTLIKSADEFGTVIPPSFSGTHPEIMIVKHGLNVNAWRAVALAARQNADAAIDILEAEHDFFRKLLTNTDSLYMKSVAQAGLMKSIYVYSWLFDNFPDKVIARLPQELSEVEQSLAHVMRNEASGFLHAARLGRDRVSRHEFSSSPLRHVLFRLLPYDENATVNRLARDVIDIANASTLSAREFHKRYDGYEGSSPDSMEWLVNGAGMLVYRDIFKTYSGYIDRFHDVNALIRILHAKAYFHQRNASDETVAGQISSLPNRLRNPCDDSLPFIDDGLLQFRGNATRRFPLALPIHLTGSISN